MEKSYSAGLCNSTANGRQSTRIKTRDQDGGPSGRTAAVSGGPAAACYQLAKLQAPNTKLQRNPKLQIPMPLAMQVWPPAKPLSPPTDPMQRERAVLELGAWSFSGAWSLELGIFCGWAPPQPQSGARDAMAQSARQPPLDASRITRSLLASMTCAENHLHPNASVEKM